MAGDEDDYLSDKFLVEASSSSPKTYAQLRKDAERQAKLKNEQNRIKGRRQRELESREEGLSKSLFERAEEEENAGGGTGSKALSIMMKMGFKPGQTLGTAVDEKPAKSPKSKTPDGDESEPQPEEVVAGSLRARPQGFKTNALHVPLPLNEWRGKVGIGVRKRSPSPTSAERVAKMAKMAEDATHETFRDRARQEYEERRAEGRLCPAQRTCVTLDEKAGKMFNVLWLNPADTASFPDGLMDTLDKYTSAPVLLQQDHRGSSIEWSLRQQMKADALRPLTDSPRDALPTHEWSSDTIKEALQYLRLNARDRLSLLLAYLRDKYAYCFWCGTQYDDDEEMSTRCPGENEEDHD